MKQLTIAVHAFPGDRVSVKNYRRAGRWETGEVVSVETHHFETSDEAVSRNNYNVRTERKDPSGAQIKLYVGEDEIRILEKHNLRWGSVEG